MKNWLWLLMAAGGVFVGWEAFRAVHGRLIAAQAAANPAFFAIAPGITEVGTVNSTGGFTAAPDPNGIGGGFAT